MDAIAAALVPAAYLLGTFPSALIVAGARGLDVTQEGSGNPGASNVARLAGWRAGGVVLALDFAKGALAAGCGLVVGGRPGGWLLGVAAVVGHVFPATRGFRGGKGVATAAGALVLLFPGVGLVLAPVWLLVALVLRKASLASLAVTVAFPVLVALFGYPAWEVGATVALALLVLVRHAANIRRLVRGSEHSLPGGSVPRSEEPR